MKLSMPSLLEVVHACRSAGNYEHGASGEFLECLRCVLCVLVVTGAKHHDIGFLLHCGVNAFLDCVESDVVDNLISSATEEVRRELGAGQTHGEVADGEHEHLGTVCGTLGVEAELLELACSAVKHEGCHGAVGLFLLGAAATATAGFALHLVESLLVEVGELVGAEERFLAAGDIEMAL